MGRGHATIGLGLIGRISVLFAVFGHGAALAQTAPAQSDTAQKTGAGETRLPVLLNGDLIGDMNVDVSDGRISFDSSSLYALADPALDDGARRYLRYVDNGGRSTLFDMTEQHLSLRYDEHRRALLLSAPYAHIQTIAVDYAPQAAPPEAAPALASAPPAPRAPDSIGAANETTPLLWRGKRLGNVHVHDDRAGRVEIAAADVRALAGELLTSDDLAMLQILQTNDMLSPFALPDRGLSLVFDERTRTLILTAPDMVRTQTAASAAVQATPAPAVNQTAPVATAIVASASSPPAPSPPPQLVAAPVTTVDAAPPIAPQTNSSSAQQMAPAPTLVVAAAAPVVAPPQPNAAPPSTTVAARPSRNAQLDFVYPLMLEGSYQGDISIRIAPDGTISIPLDRVLELIASKFQPSVSDVIRAHAVDGRLAPFADPAGVRLEFDDALQELHLSVPAALRRTEDISLAGETPGVSDIRLERAAPFSAYLNYDVTQTWDNDPLGQSGREALQGVVETGIRLFGDSGAVLESRGLYQEGADHQFSRGETLLVYDDVKRMVSVELGDVRMSTSTFQSAPPIGGLLIERTFSLQPTRNYRPAGSHAIVIDRRTAVDVYVNGAEMRRLDLQPGRYDLRDFPFVDGANNVTLELEDDLGQHNTIDLSTYFDNELLAPGVSEFSYAFGAPATTEAEGITYDSNVFVYSMYHRLGITPTLTLGVNAQGRDSASLYGGEALWASPIGTIGLDYAHSRNPAAGEGDAVLLHYSFQSQPIGNFTWNVSLSSQWQSLDFSSIDDDGPANNQYTTQTDASLRLYQPDWGTATFGLSYDQAALPALNDRYQASFGYSRRLFGNLFGALQVNHIEGGDRSETTAAVSLSWRMGVRDQVSARTDTNTQVSELDWHHSGSYGVGGISTDARIGHDTDTGESFANGAISYFGNRLEATLSEDSRTEGLTNDTVSNTTTARIGGGVAFAGAHVAIGRPVRGAFAIVEGHPSLKNRQIQLGVDDDGRPRAQTGLFGPALVPNLNPYSNESVSVDVNNLPPGYDLGAGQLDFRAYRGAGYDVRVGSAANLTIMANVVGPDGAPIGMIGGELRNLDHPDAPPIQGFSNRSGRFVAAGVSPGRYTLTMFTDPPTKTQITITPAQAGLVQLGIVHLEESQ
ncbi:MAG TPA: fimbria/pilus outer membrane usher protein [Vitreimonas sp.]|nr:fimbria/pilus outer membrane usher protein [Vitreimonas sp.]